MMHTEDRMMATNLAKTILILVVFMGVIILLANIIA